MVERARCSGDSNHYSSSWWDLCWRNPSSISIFAPLIKSIMLGLEMTCQSVNPHYKLWARRRAFPTNGTWGLTFVNVTFGTMTVFSALGASLGDLFLSPPGWYWYLKFWPALSPFELPTCHGMLPSAILTLASDEAEVGLRPGTKVCKVLEMVALGTGWEVKCTKIETSEAEGASHDSQEDLDTSILE